MLSRGNSDTNSRLRRAKSSSSVKRPQHASLANNPIDPEIAHQHAIAAAQRAMGRASERKSEEMSRQSALMRNDITKSNTTTIATPIPEAVRFVGPAASHKPREIKRNQASSRASTNEHPGSPGLLLTAIPQINDDGLEDGFNSTPSSYRRLRKAKSMFSPRKRALSAFAASTPPKSEASQFRGVGRQSYEDVESRVSLRLRRSMSFIRGGGEQLARVFKRNEGNDAAIQMARDQFLHQLEQQRLRKRPSFLFAPKLRRQQKAFRKTVRTSSATSYGPAISSSELQNHDVEKSGTTMRSLSASIRGKFKRVFGRPSDTQFPAQQLDATRPHFRDYVPAESGINQDYEDIPTLDGRPRSRDTNRALPLRHAPSNAEIHSLAGSIRSMPSRESLSNKTSRISSWADSTAANTVISASAIERKRLSVIQEHGGPHQPSSSAGRVGDGYSVFRKPLRSHSRTSKSNNQVDPQRVYSALVKRIDENNPPKRQPNDSLREEPEQTDTRENYKQSQHLGTTIRTVPKELTLDLAAAEAFGRQSSSQRQISRKPAQTRTNIRLTPQQVAQHNEGILNLPKQPPLREVRSTLFPFTTEIKPQTPSPFKRAMTARQGSQFESDEETSSVIVTRQVDTYQPTAIHRRRDSSTTGSGSVYSRTTSGNTPGANEDVPSPASSDETVEPGTAVILTVAPPLAQHQHTSVTRPPLHATESSGEWKTWVNSQMATLDRQNSLQNKPAESYRPAPIHYRENAQIDGDDTQVGKPQYPSALFLARTGPPVNQPRIPSRPSSLHRRTSAMNDRFPLIETKSVRRKASFHSQRQLASPVPSQYGYNDENRRVSAVPANRPPSSIRVRTSHATLRSERNYSDPRPPSAASYRPPEKNVIVLSSSESNPPTPRKDMNRPQSSITLRENYGRSTPNVLRHIPSHRSGLSNRYLSENRRFVPPTLREKSYEGDDESVTPNGRSSVGSKSSKKMVDLFLSSRRHLQKQQRRVPSSVEDSGTENAFV